MFSLGAYAITAYLAHASIVQTYGDDAASIVVLLLWVHYSAQNILPRVVQRRVGGNAPRWLHAEKTRQWTKPFLNASMMPPIAGRYP